MVHGYHQHHLFYNFYCPFHSLFTCVRFFSVGGVVLQSYIATHSTAARAVAFLGKIYFLCIDKTFILLHLIQAHGYLTSIQKMDPCEFTILSFYLFSND